jgi:hypothetical protein
VSKDLDRITDYLKANHVLSLATVRGSHPWAASCFYVLDPAAMALLLMTEPGTRHGAEMTANDAVAGTISSQESNVARIQGIQFAGTARRLDGEVLNAGLALYLRRFPVARLHPAPLWAVQLTSIKFTDNTFGFGHKALWTR